ncbi:MAG: cytochrome c peroxidase [Gammaproteobacteria bacterium]
MSTLSLANRRERSTRAAWRERVLATTLALTLSCAALSKDDPAAVSFTPRERALILTLSPPQPAAKDTTNHADGNPEAVKLGKTLFFDPRLSGDGRFSCASCHDPTRNWADGKEVATAAGQGTRNTPSLWNVASNRWFFWDGRADSLWSQALKPIERDMELDGSRLQVAHLIAADSSLRVSYEKLFGKLPDLSDSRRFPAAGGPRASDETRLLQWWQMDGDDRQSVTRVFANVGKAIAAFEATLVTATAPFDRFAADLRGGKAQSAAIGPSAQRGLQIFIGRGNCVLCHSGPLFTNMEFHDTRVPRRPGTEPDAGRLTAMTSLAEDEFVSPGPYSDDPTGRRARQLFYLDAQAGSPGHFKTPGLRNVALTPPYMHAGQLATLRDVAQHYNKLEDAAPPADPLHVEALIKPLGLSESEVDDLVAFLESLTSEPPNATK